MSVCTSVKDLEGDKPGKLGGMSHPARYAFRGAEVLSRADAVQAPRLAALDCSAVHPSAAVHPAAATTPGAAALSNPKDCVSIDGAFFAETHPAGTPAPEGWEWLPFRTVIGTLPEAEWKVVAHAMGLANWHAATRFCGHCGSPNEDKSDELARQCPACGALSFPRISPAVLAVVTRGDRLLLGRNRANKTGMWSVLAGFVEPGETFEDCVQREVMEEVGIVVRPTGYLGSQPWPFPDQLMVGIAAEWVSGELAPDGDEIAEADWFGPDDHPPIPMHGSLSRRVIDLAFERIRGRQKR